VILNYFKVSLLMMRAKPVRSALSLLGIYVGVMALVIILAIREGIRGQIEDTFRTEGASIVFVHPGFDQATMRMGRLNLDDLERLNQTPGVLSTMPRLSAEKDVRTRAVTLHAHVTGADDKFFSVFRIPVVRGRVFIRDEIARKQPVCLLTAQAAEKLFPLSEPVGSFVDMEGISFQVIGVTDWDGAAAQRTNVMEVDLFLPVTWLLPQANEFLPMAEVRLAPQMEPAQALRIVKKALSHNDPKEEPLYFVRSMQEFVEQTQKMSDRILQGLLAIAGISLLVGGIGVANVMVTSVTERTREVGIRKALGARRHDILFQFLVESSLMCGSGGCLAVATGVLCITVLRSLIHIPFPVNVTPAAMATCIFLTVGIGLVAGAYPASRAAALSPAEALRYE